MSIDFTGSDHEVLWSAGDNRKMAALLHSKDRYVLYGGQRGGAKTEAFIADSVGLLNSAGPAIDFPGYRAVMLRRSFPDLRELIDRASAFYNLLRPGTIYHKTEKCFHFPSGAKIYLGFTSEEEDWKRFQGWELHWIGWEEVTQQPFPDPFHNLNTSLRQPHRSPDHPLYVDIDALKIRATCNPGGLGHAWVQDFWRIPNRPDSTKVYAFEVDGLARKFIPASVWDNPHIQNREEYIAQLRQTLSPAMAAAHVDGWWDQPDIKGSIYKEQMFTLRDRSQIKEVPYDPRVPVNTFWDVGVSDQTAIWFHQRVRGEDRFIDFYQQSQQPARHFVRELQRRPYVYGCHFLPHETDHRKMRGDDLKTLRDIFEDLGLFPIVVVPRVSDIRTGIELTRGVLPTVFIDEANCKDGITALDNYRYQFDEKTGTYRTIPLHDVYSHAADAFRQFAQAYEEIDTSAEEVEDERREALFDFRVKQGELDPRIARRRARGRADLPSYDHIV